MTKSEHDDGLTHEHDWATGRGAVERPSYPRAADTRSLPTPSSVFHDDHMQGD